MDSCFYFDLETTGLNPYYDEIIEIGIISTDFSRESLSILVSPNRELSSEISRLTGITDAMLQEKGVPIKMAIQMLHQFIRRHTKPRQKVWLIAHNSNGFDEIFYKSTLFRHQIRALRPTIHWLDSCCLAKLVVPQMFNFRLISLCRYFKLNQSQEHRALADCELLEQLFPILIREYKKKYPSNKSNMLQSIQSILCLSK